LIQVKDRGGGDRQPASLCRGRDRAMLNAAIVGPGWWGETMARLLTGSATIRVAKAVTRSAAGREAVRVHGLCSSTSHLAALARERGIPMVLGVFDATRQIPDGAVVAVDGVAGIVR
jgi:predicted dehydrogenase